MGAAENSENLKQNENQASSKDSLEREPISTKRGPRIASILICLAAAAGIIIYGFIEKTAFEYNAVHDLTAIKLEKIKNGTIRIYTRQEKDSYPVLFNLGLGLLALIFGTVVDRLSLVVEEMCQFRRRYKSNIRKVVKSCFSGVSWTAVVVIVIISAISLSVSNNNSFHLKHWMYILGGIGVGPFVTHLLNLNTQSHVDISRFLEEKKLYPASTLAWNYYFQYLRHALIKFHKVTCNSDTPVQNQDQDTTDETTQTKVKLSSDKLILVISHDCKTKQDLSECDSHIRKIDDIQKDGYTFPVYGFKSNGTEHKYVAKFAKEPLETLREMGKCERIKVIPEKECKNQAELFYRTLVSDILKDPLDDQCCDKCIVVPIMTENAKSLQNGGLVKLIMAKVNEVESGAPGKEETDAFMKAPTPKKKQIHTQENDEKQMKKSLRKDSPNSSCSLKDMEEGKCKKSYTKFDNFTDGRKNKDDKEVTFELDEFEFKSEEASGGLQRKYKGKSNSSEKLPMLPSAKSKQKRRKFGQDKGIIQTMMTTANRQESTSGIEEYCKMEENEKHLEPADYFVNEERSGTSDGNGSQQRHNNLIDEGGNSSEKYEYKHKTAQRHETQNNPGQFLKNEQKKENDNKGECDMSDNQSKSDQAMGTQSSPHCPHYSISSYHEDILENGKEENKLGKEQVVCDSTPSHKQIKETHNEKMPGTDNPGDGKTFQRVSVIVQPLKLTSQEEEAIINLENSNTFKNGGDIL